MAARPAALVTGAGRGIGRACVVALARRGYDVVVNERSPAEDTDATIAAVEAEGGEAIVVHGDIADIAGHEALLDEAWAAFDHLECLVDNAGVSVLSRGDLLDITTESYDRCMAVNARGTFFLTQAFARRILSEPAGPWHRAIVMITSVNAAEVVAVTRGEYGMSKAAASMAAKLFAARLAPEGIGVYEVRPGIIRTEMTEPSKARYDRFFAEGGAAIARWGEPDEVGRCVATLAAGDLPYTVGQAVLVDGGQGMLRL
jgi:NAD(P)-dependent dehydrogenase (short-subunit alcohol dehydrogenase family)